MITVYIDLFKIPQVGIEISTVVSTYEALEWGNPFISSLDNNLLHGYFFQEHYPIFKTTEVTSSQEKKSLFPQRTRDTSSMFMAGRVSI